MPKRTTSVGRNPGRRANEAARRTMRFFEKRADLPKSLAIPTAAERAVKKLVEGSMAIGKEKGDRPEMAIREILLAVDSWSSQIMRAENARKTGRTSGITPEKEKQLRFRLTYLQKEWRKIMRRAVMPSRGFLEKNLVDQSKPRTTKIKLLEGKISAANSRIDVENKNPMSGIGAQISKLRELLSAGGTRGFQIHLAETGVAIKLRKLDRKSRTAIQKEIKILELERIALYEEIKFFERQLRRFKEGIANRK